MYKKYPTLCIILTTIALMFTPLAFVYAVSTSYVPLEPNAFPGVNTSSASGNLGSFLNEIFNFGIAIAVVLALIMIIWGGIEYMTTDAWSGKEEGRKKINDALLGLGIALISYLLLYIINPTLVTFQGNTVINPQSTPSGISASNTTGGTTNQ